MSCVGRNRRSWERTKENVNVKMRYKRARIHPSRLTFLCGPKTLQVWDSESNERQLSPPWYDHYDKGCITFELFSECAWSHRKFGKKIIEFFSRALAHRIDRLNNQNRLRRVGMLLCHDLGIGMIYWAISSYRYHWQGKIVFDNRILLCRYKFWGQLTLLSWNNH